jgi:imidazolonepropionase-like amidohydrolase
MSGVAVRFVRPAVRMGLILPALLASACNTPGGDGSDARVFEGARLILGDGGVIEDGLLVVEGDRITAAGSRAETESPAGATRIDVSGKTIMPALVNAHFHLSSVQQERVDQLRHMAYYGSGSVLSLGLDDGDLGLLMRDEVVPDAARSQSAGRGITSPEEGRSTVPFWVTSEEEARAAVRDLAVQEVDFVKIWVDARGGRYERLSPELYAAVIDEAHANGLRVTAHVFTLEDAKGLLLAGIDAFAHGVRDMDIDDELISLWRERPHVVLVPNLPGPGVAADLAWLGGTIPADELEEMQAAQVDRPAAQESFGIQARSLQRLHAAGVTIAFGTDGGSPWAAHLELEDMVRTGMSPADVIVAATMNSAALMEMPDVGTLAAGMSADFLVLDANPLDDITNTREISGVYLRGVEVDRRALGERFRGGG